MKFLFGRVTFYVTQVEAETEEGARDLLNRSNARLNECPVHDPLEGVGTTHKYQKAWVEPEGTMMQARPMVLAELRDVLQMMDYDGSRRPVIYDGNGRTTGPLGGPIGS